MANYNVRTYGAAGDGKTDDTASIQAAITAALAGGGGIVSIPAGNYVVSTGIVLTEPVPDDSLGRVSIVGEGSGASQLLYTGTGTCLTVNAASAFGDYFSLSGFRVQNAAPLASQVGIRIVDCAYFGIDDVIALGFDYGIVGYDILSCTFNRVQTKWCVYGFTAQRTSASNPNAILFTGCEFGQNSSYGLTLGDPSTATFVGCNFENNGAGGAIINSNRGLPLEGSASAVFAGCYFEGNGGAADLQFLAGGSDGPTSLLVQGCTFNRSSGTVGRFATNCIAAQFGTGAKAQLTAIGNGFNGFNDYVPSAARTYIAVTSAGAPWGYSDGGGSNLYGSPIESPALGGAVRASCVFNGIVGGLVPGGCNVASVVRNGVGDYTIHFTNPLPAYFTPSVTLGIVGIPTIYQTDPTWLRFQTWSLAGVMVDSGYIAVNIVAL